MRALSTPFDSVRLLAALLGTAALVMALTGCSETPEAIVTRADPAPVVSSASSDAPLVTGPTNMDSEPLDGQPASAPVVNSEAAPPSTPRATAPATPKRPATPVISAPAPERPPMPAPTPTPAAPRDIAGADAFWTRFQSAVKRQDRAAIQAGLAETIRVGDRTFARSSEPVQDVITAVVEQEEVQDAYLAVERLTHGASGSTFRTTVSYDVDGESYDVVVFGTVARVASGEWKLVEVGSEG